MKFGIRYKYTDERAFYEAKLKGWRGDILVKINNNRYCINVLDMFSLSQNFNRAFIKYGCYSIEDNIIIVSEVTNSEIKKTIFELSKTDFFNKLGGKIDNNNLNNSDNSLEIFYLNDTDKYYETAFKNGYRDDIIVRTCKKEYNMCIMTIDRILQDYGYETRINNYYLTKPNLIIVREMTKFNIEKTIFELHKIGFFKRLGCLEDKENWGIFEYMHNKKC